MAHRLSRKNNGWQKRARYTGDKGEFVVRAGLKDNLGDDYIVKLKPPKIITHGDKGIELDLKVESKKTGKILFLEVKTGNNGGNATEERGAKFLSNNITRMIKKSHPSAVERPVMILFGGKNYNGKNGDMQSYRADNKYKAWVHPHKRREEVKCIYDGGMPYDFIDEGFVNAPEVAHKIQELLA